MIEWTPDKVLEKGEQITDRLEQMLEPLGVFHVMPQPYGKDDLGIRLSIVKLAQNTRSEGQVLTVVYAGNRLKKRTVKNLASGPFGEVKRILKAKEDESKIAVR